MGNKENNLLSDQQSAGKSNNVNNEAFIPVPLKYFGARQLCRVPIYIKSDSEYCLYSGDSLGFSNTDRQRLLDSKIKHVYVLSKDNDKLFDDIGDSLFAMIEDNTIDFSEKKEYLHRASMNLAMRLDETPPDSNQIDQTISNSQCNAQMVANGMTLKEMFALCANNESNAVHLVKMASIMQGFAFELGLNDKHSLSVMGAGAMLHDVGKLFLPETQRTVENLREHVELGVNHLNSLPNVPREVVNIVAEHHERIDGSGYPYGLKGDNISLIGQISGLAYTFENLLSELSYKSEKESISESLNILEKQYAGRFDSNMLSSFKAYASTVLLDKAENRSKIYQFSLSSLDSEHKKANPSGRRHQRLFFRAKGTADILYLKNDKWTVQSSHDIFLHNISQSGMGFMIYNRLETNQVVLVKLSVGFKSEPVNLLGKVKRTQIATNGLYVTGCAFFETYSPEDTKKLFERLDRK